MVFDTYHLGQEPGIVERIAADCPAGGHRPVGRRQDRAAGRAEPLPAGRGRVPLKEIVAALKAAGYDGYYDVELLGEEIETIDYQSLLEHAKTAFAELVGGGKDRGLGIRDGKRK